MTDTILELEVRKVVLFYDDLRPVGTLADTIGVFTFFPNLACNEAFLNLINYTEACVPGDGLCENMVRYHHVGVQERLRFQEDQDHEPPPSLLVPLACIRPGPRVALSEGRDKLLIDSLRSTEL